jgi:hypothetical protein
MARFSISGRATIAGTSALPLVSLYAVSGVRPTVLEVGVFNTTSTALVVSLNRLTTAGTQGTGLTETPEDSPDHAALATGFAGHTAGPTIGGELRRATLAAAVGSGVIWTFAAGVEIPAGTANGLGLIVPAGTGQILDYHISWSE